MCFDVSKINMTRGTAAQPRSRESASLTHAVLTFLFATGLASAGCLHSTQADAQAATEQSAPLAEDGVIRIQQASLPFIDVQAVSGEGTQSSLSAPARVDFRDGAVSQVGAPLEGRVVAVHVRLTQRVSLGDPLFTLDCPDAAAMRAAGHVAEAALREARLELERQRRMQREGVGIERDVVSAETKVSAAEAELARVAAGAISIGTGNASAVVVRSPINGVVISRKASLGMAVQKGGDPLVEVADGSALWVVADVFERDLPRIRTGLKSLTSFTSTSGPVEGTVSAVGTVVDSGLRTAPVYISVPSSATTLRPGMFGRTRIETADSVLTLPVTAVLIKDGKEPIVYVQREPLVFVRRRVVIGQPVEGRVQVVSGLSPGDKVVVTGALLLDGAADQLL